MQLPANSVRLTAREMRVLSTANSSIHKGKKIPRECRKKLEARNPMVKA
jgi:hypothetical protein